MNRSLAAILKRHSLPADAPIDCASEPCDYRAGYIDGFNACLRTRCEEAFSEAWEDGRAMGMLQGIREGWRDGMTTLEMGATLTDEEKRELRRKIREMVTPGWFRRLFGG